MGVVRREGDWRLVKRGDGSYEITYQKDPQLKVFTPDYSRSGFASTGLDTIPVRDVESYSEAEGLFEEMAHGGPPMGYSSFGASDRSGVASIPELQGSTDLDEGVASELDDVDLPPAGIALVLLLVGGFMIYTSGLSLGSQMFFMGAVITMLGLGIFGWAGFLHRTNGPSAALEFLISTGDSGGDRETGNEQESTPPLPERHKNQLIFDRANRYCEWCEKRFDHHHVHHIKPRREGGPNRPSNLIVLCPTCHDKADRGTMARSKLRAKVRQATDLEFD